MCGALLAILLTDCKVGTIQIDYRVVRNELTSIYAQYDLVAFGYDSKARLGWYERNTAKDFQQELVTGQVSTRAQVLETMRWATKLPDLPKSNRASSNKSNIKKLTVKGDTVVAYVEERCRADVSKGMRIETTSDTSDTWKKREGDWQLVKREFLSHKVIINGKEYHPSRSSYSPYNNDARSFWPHEYR
jgi:hypothetical protein